MIPIAIEKTFRLGPPRTDYSDCVLIVRHGFCSDHKPFIPLSQKLLNYFKPSAVDNDDYIWTKPVIENGIRLALHILKTYRDDQPICLIGHSMGGLVCRVANVALSNPIGVNKHLQALTVFPDGRYLYDARNEAPALRKRPVGGLITLATPNSATLTHGQIAQWFKLASRAAVVGFPNKTDSFIDLTTKRLFLFLQKYGVKTPVLSISGSAHNRFAKQKPALGKLVGIAGSLAVPNDGLVEDRSVDLGASILPNEIVHLGTSPYLHLRAYPDCTDVTHSGIYDANAVFESIAAFISWVL